ncbi:CBS domain-containing protein [Dyella flagellata]
MTPRPRCCAVGDSLRGVARIMREANVGQPPVVDETKCVPP